MLLDCLLVLLLLIYSYFYFLVSGFIWMFVLFPFVIRLASAFVFVFFEPVIKHVDDSNEAEEPIDLLATVAVGCVRWFFKILEAILPYF